MKFVKCPINKWLLLGEEFKFRNTKLNMVMLDSTNESWSVAGFLEML